MRTAILAAALASSAALPARTPEALTPPDPAAVAAFADGFFPREMDARHIPGLVFVFVSRGDVAIARGYGFAELEPPRRVDPDRTIFRLASVSKTITATAALQLVERGGLDLHRDVNGYLTGFQLPSRHGTITLHHLLTHTAGFDERLIGVAARTAEELQPAARYLADSMPPTFVEPGRVISYSNHGFALIGLLVQEASRRPFADYVREQVFEPLGMRRSGSMTGQIPADLAVAYEFANGRHRPLSPDYLQISSAGSFFTTGSDMARFLIAQLRGGAYGGGRLLHEDTIARMHARQFTQTRDTSGWAYGLWEDARDGRRALLHNGGGKGYRALIYLLPEQDAGFFLAYNLADRHAEGELLELFITRFRRAFVPAAGGGAEGAYEHASTEPFVGDYVYVRRARTTLEKMISIVNRVRIGLAENGTLTITGSSYGPVALTAVGPLLFRRADGRGLVAFEAEGTRPDRLTLLMDSGFPAVYDRVPFAATLRGQLWSLTGLALIFLYAALLRPILAGVRRRRAGKWDSIRWSRWLAGAAGSLNLLFLVAFPLAFIGRMEGGVPEFLYGVPVLAGALLLIPPLTSVLAVAASIVLVGIWRDGRTPLAARLEHSLVTAALVAFVAFAWYWRVLPPG